MDNFTSYKEAEQVAKQADKLLRATDFNPGGLVQIIHEEGTVLHYKSAFIKEWKDWILVFTEHHGTHVYHKSDLSSWGTYLHKDSGKLKDTGHQDKCEFCQKEFKVENLNYSHHPDWNKYEESKYWIYCEDCANIVGSEHEALWRKLNESGQWDFTWGRDDIEHIKKACATIMKEEVVDQWLDTSSPGFRKTPRNAILNGDYEKVLIAIYQMGCGEFI